MATETLRTAVWEDWIAAEVRASYRTPTWVPAVMTLLVATISAYLLVSQNIKNAVECADLAMRWSKLATQYRDLWNDLDAEDVAVRLARADDAKAEASKAGAAFSYSRFSERRMTKWFDLVVANRTPRAA